MSENLEKDKKTIFIYNLIQTIFNQLRLKIIFFEIIVILFTALTIGIITSLNIKSILIKKAHLLSENSVKNLARSIENNYMSISAVDDLVKTYRGIEGILYLGYNGIIISGNTRLDKHIYFGETNAEFNIFEDLGTNYILQDKRNHYKYFMPVTVKSAQGVKKIGYVSLCYSKAIIEKSVIRVQALIIIITIVVIGLSIIISIIGSNTIVNPITNLTNAVKLVGEGNYKVQIKIPSNDEIGILARTFNNMVISIREKLEMQKFVSSSTVKMIKSNIDQELDASITRKKTERKALALFFSDVRGFTSMSEKMDPEQVISILNEYLDIQSNIIKENNGDIDKFVGDEIVAIFEGDDACDRAVKAAIECQRKVRQLNEERTKRGDNPVYIGVGLNYGEVVTGSVGSHDRMDYTVIGDNVNLTARLCSAAEKAQIIASKYLYDKLSDKSIAKPLEPIMVKGKAKPIEIYSIEY